MYLLYISQRSGRGDRSNQFKVSIRRIGSSRSSSVSLRPSWATRDSVPPSEGERNFQKSWETYFQYLCDYIYWSVGKTKCHLLKKLCVGNQLISTVEYSSDHLSTKMSPFQEPTSCTVLFSTQGGFSVSHVSWRGNWSTTNLLDGSCIAVRLWAVRKHTACLKSPLCLGKMLDKAWKIAQQLPKYRGLHTYIHVLSNFCSDCSFFLISQYFFFNNSLVIL